MDKELGFPVGFEPTTQGFRSLCSGQTELREHGNNTTIKTWRSEQDFNLQPSGLEPVALSVELPEHLVRESRIFTYCIVERLAHLEGK